MPTLKQQLAYHGFSKAGIAELTGTDKSIYFRLEPTFSRFRHGMPRGIVYLWVVLEKSIPKLILYVGGTGGTLGDRCAQHESDFRNRRRATVLSYLKHIISQGKSIAVYARISQLTEHLGEPISSYPMDEKAFLKKFSQIYQLLNIRENKYTLTFEEQLAERTALIEQPSPKRRVRAKKTKHPIK